tara:strand:- start:895 stop:1101 length:207 start_codon:yes stop_codon:yes gene_type:complete
MKDEQWVNAIGVKMQEGDQFRVLVKRMREVQKQYFKHRSPDLLIRCRELEKKVDLWLNEQTMMKFDLE